MDIEQRIDRLEQQQLDQYSLCTLVLTLLIRRDDQLRRDIAEDIRNILIHPSQTHPLSAGLETLMRQLRADLLDAPNQALADAMAKSPIRPVD